MKITNLFLLFLFPFFTMAQTADAVIEKYLEATNGKGKIENISNFKFDRSYVANSTSDYDEEVVINGEKDQLSRKKTLLKRDFFFVLNDKDGWVKIPMGNPSVKVTYSTKDLSAKEKEELRTEVTDGVVPFLNFEKKGYKLSEPVSVVTLSGKSTSKLVLEKGDIKREYYFDNNTGLVLREMLVENGITHTMDYTKYDNTSLGVKLPVVYTYINTKDKRKNTVTTKWSFDNKIFEGVSFVK